MVAGNPQLIRRYNLDLIRNLITVNGPVTKPDLAKLANLSVPTVNKIVDQLESDGAICSDEAAVGGIGRRALTYVINKDAAKAIVIFAVNDEFQSCVTNSIGERSHELRTPIPPSDADAFACLTDVIDIHLRQVPAEEVKAIGVGVPGIVKPDGCVSSIPAIPSFEKLPLKKRLEARYHIPSFIENDVKLMSVGFYRTNLVEKCDNMVFLYVGKGIGAGTILNKKLQRGSSSFAGELGYMSLSESKLDDQPAGAVGSLERQILPLMRQTVASGGADQTAALAYHKTISRVIANFVSMLDPEVIVVRSPAIHAEALAEIEQMLRCFVPIDNLPTLIEAESDDYGLAGAIYFTLANITSNLMLVNQVDV